MQAYTDKCIVSKVEAMCGFCMINFDAYDPDSDNDQTGAITEAINKAKQDRTFLKGEEALKNIPDVIRVYFDPDNKIVPKSHKKTENQWNWLIYKLIF